MCQIEVGIKTQKVQHSSDLGSYLLKVTNHSDLDTSAKKNPWHEAPRSCE